MTDLPEGTVDRALDYASRGWPVFPCKPGSKAPATEHGFRDASTDPDRIRSWWTRMPDANVAIATGLPGPDVLDVDQHGRAGNGFRAFGRLVEVGLVGRPSEIVVTPSLGLHAYYSGSQQVSGRLPRHHLDFRAAGGYVLAPPSRVDGKPYRLIQVNLGADDGLSWSAVAGLLEPRQDRPAQSHAAGRAQLGRLAAWVETLAEGNRNSGLFWAACRAVEADELGVLDDLAAAAAKTGLAEPEITRTISSARRTAQPAARREPEGERG
ncbi:MAG TPA: bifunctional DNA primase/polymerase [Streptosporangiaceae bacterium]|nr:bifunctional DNA primase/polymerase [Streptosporangiaceae bacterium]